MLTDSLLAAGYVHEETSGIHSLNSGPDVSHRPNAGTEESRRDRNIQLVPEMEENTPDLLLDLVSI